MTLSVDKMRKLVGPDAEKRRPLNVDLLRARVKKLPSNVLGARARRYISDVDVDVEERYPQIDVESMIRRAEKLKREKVAPIIGFVNWMVEQGRQDEVDPKLWTSYIEETGLVLDESGQLRKQTKGEEALAATRGAAEKVGQIGLGTLSVLGQVGQTATAGSRLAWGIPEGIPIGDLLREKLTTWRAEHPEWFARETTKSFTDYAKRPFKLLADAIENSGYTAIVGGGVALGAGMPVAIGMGVGQIYNVARDHGADPAHASLYALIAGPVYGAIEMAQWKGIAAMSKTLLAAKERAALSISNRLLRIMSISGQVLKQDLVIAAHEGFEEVLQGLIEQGVEISVEGKPLTLKMIPDTAKRMAEEFMQGAAIATVLGGLGTAANLAKSGVRADAKAMSSLEALIERGADPIAATNFILNEAAKKGPIGLVEKGIAARSSPLDASLGKTAPAMGKAPPSAPAPSTAEFTRSEQGKKEAELRKVRAESLELVGREAKRERVLGAYLKALETGDTSLIAKTRAVWEEHLGQVEAKLDLEAHKESLAKLREFEATKASDEAKPIVQELRSAIASKDAGAIVKAEAKAKEFFKAHVGELAERAEEKPAPGKVKLVEFLELEAKVREEKGLKFPAKAYRKAAASLEKLETLPDSVEAYRKLEGFGEKLSKVAFEFARASDADAQIEALRVEQAARMPETKQAEKPKAKPSDARSIDAGNEFHKYEAGLLERDSKGKKLSYGIPTWVYLNFTDRASRIERKTGAVGAFKAANRVELAGKHFDDKRLEFENALLEVGADVHKMPITQARLAVEYMTSGRASEELWPEYKAYADVLRKWDDSFFKSIVKKHRIDLYAIKGMRKHLTPKQIALIEHFKPMHRANPERYFAEVEKFVKSEASNALVVENYFTRTFKASDLGKVESIEVDFHKDKHGAPGQTLLRPFMARKGMEPVIETDKNPFLQMYWHYRALMKTSFLSEPINTYHAIVKPRLDLRALQAEKEVLRKMVGMGKLRGPISLEIQAAGGNLWKVVAAMRSLPLKNVFQQFQGQAFRRGWDHLRLKGVISEKGFVKKWGERYPNIADKLRIDVEQGRPILTEMFALGLERANWRQLGWTGNAIRFFGNNPVLRASNRILADQLAYLHTRVLDKVNRITSMDKVMSDGWRALIEQKLSWSKAKMHLSLGSQSEAAQMYIADLVAKGQLKDAIYEAARLNTKATQFEYKKVLRDLLSNTAVGQPLMQYSTWWRNYTLMYYRALQNVVHRRGVGGGIAMGKLVGLTVFGGVTFMALVARLRPGRDLPERLLNSAAQTLNPLSWEGIGGPNTLVAPVARVVKWAKGDAPSQLLAQARAFVLGADAAGRVLYHLYLGEGIDERETERAKSAFAQLLNIGDAYANTFYWGWRQVEQTVDLFRDTRRAKLLREAGKLVLGIDYTPWLQQRSTLQKILGFIWMKNPSVSGNELDAMLGRATDSDLSPAMKLKMIDKLYSNGLTLESSLKRIDELGKKLSEKGKRKWSIRQVNFRRSWLRQRWSAYDKQRAKGEVESQKRTYYYGL